jgi:hypothetical protein
MLSSLKRSPLFVLVAIATGVVWTGCATANGDPAVDEPGTPPTQGGGTTKADASVRPDFEAGFPEELDAGNNVDPTPDGGGDTCVDNGDPGGAENTAKGLPNTDDAQNSPIVVKGILNGSTDTDFYKVHVEDKSFHLLQPDLQIANSGVEMCVFVKCDTNGQSNVTCSAPAVAKKSDIGTDGCCGNGPSAVTPGWDCKSTTDSAQLFVRIRETTNVCRPYSWSYAF